jgi:hypothetical protein
MAPPSRLDLRRLARDAAAAPGSRREMRAPGGRPATGLMEAVRINLDALVALQVGGLTWDAVAAGLTAQGFTTADGQPVTGRNLTGIISSVRRQAVAREARMAARAARSDRPPPARALTELANPAPPPSRLAPELSRDHPSLGSSREARAPSTSEAPLSEAEIRRLQAEKHSHLFKKD